MQCYWFYPLFFLVYECSQKKINEQQFYVFKMN